MIASVEPLQLAQDIGSKWIYWPWVGDHLDEIRMRLGEHITPQVSC